MAIAKKMVTILPRKKGEEKVQFKKGQLHRDLGVPQGEDIPESKKRAALAGRYGPTVKKRAVFAFKGLLAAGRRTLEKRAKK